MMFLFGYLGTFSSPPAWPIGLIHASEIAAIAAAIVAVVLAPMVRNKGPGAAQEAARSIVAAIGGVSASVALIMPIELAPMFFGVRGEWMMATIVLILFYPAAAALFVRKLYKSMAPATTRPPPLPLA